MAAMDPEEGRELSLLASGDEAAWQRFWDRYAPRIRGHIYNRLIRSGGMSAEQATSVLEDLAVDCAAKTWERVSTGAVTQSAGRYAMVVARNLVAEHLRRLGKKSRLVPLEHDIPTLVRCNLERGEDEAELRELASRFKRGLQQFHQGVVDEVRSGAPRPSFRRAPLPQLLALDFRAAGLESLDRLGEAVGNASRSQLTKMRQAAEDRLGAILRASVGQPLARNYSEQEVFPDFWAEIQPACIHDYDLGLKCDSPHREDRERQKAAHVGQVGCEECRMALSPTPLEAQMSQRLSEVMARSTLASIRASRLP